MRGTRVRAAVGTALFLVVAPGVVAGLVPWLLTGWQSSGPPGWLQAAGWALVAAGSAGLLDAFARFVVEGIGTPAPAAPTEKLVVGGLYRYVRNFHLPDYGEAAMFLSILAGIFLITAMVAAMNRSIEGKEAR